VGSSIEVVKLNGASAEKTDGAPPPPNNIGALRGREDRTFIHTVLGITP